MFKKITILKQMVVFQWKTLAFFHLNVTNSCGIFHSIKAFNALPNSTYCSQKRSKGERENS